MFRSETCGPLGHGAASQIGKSVHDQPRGLAPGMRIYRFYTLHVDARVQGLTQFAIKSGPALVSFPRPDWGKRHIRRGGWPCQPLETIPARASMADASTSAPAAICSNSAYSSSLWDNPPRHGINSMAVGATRDRWQASCPAPDVMRREGSASTSAA